jgi:uncharacterized protein (DUF1330 family)
MIITARVHDRPVMLEYASATAALVAEFGGRYILRSRDAELLEGEFGDGGGVLIIEWPDRAAARRFWDSPAYAALKAFRAGKATVRVLLVEGTLQP